MGYASPKESSVWSFLSEYPYEEDCDFDEPTPAEPVVDERDWEQVQDVDFERDEDQREDVVRRTKPDPGGAACGVL